MQRGTPKEKDPVHSAEIKDDTVVLEAPAKPPEIPPIQEPNESELHVDNANV